MEFNESQAIYLQIADYFFDNILLKKWNTDDRIPSVREIAVKLEVNPNTVMRTYTLLQDKGIIYNKRGIGYFVSANAYDLVCSIKKEAFANIEMPQFFKTMQLLNITIDDIQSHYKNYTSANK
jgi:GntR family transcriptional regulator